MPIWRKSQISHLALDTIQKHTYRLAQKGETVSVLINPYYSRLFQKLIFIHTVNYDIEVLDIQVVLISP